jgi:hypothetical protein
MEHEGLSQPTLSAVLDELIPARDASLPGAGGLGVGGYVEDRLGDATPLVAAGLAALEAFARDRHASDFAALPAAERRTLLASIDEEHPGFLSCLVFHTYTGYYQHPKVAVAIGLPPRPPHPEGYELEAGDLGLLDGVRRRAKFYRDA